MCAKMILAPPTIEFSGEPFQKIANHEIEAVKGDVSERGFERFSCLIRKRNVMAGYGCNQCNNSEYQFQALISTILKSYYRAKLRVLNNRRTSGNQLTAFDLFVMTKNPIMAIIERLEKRDLRLVCDLSTLIRAT